MYYAKIVVRVRYIVNESEASALCIKPILLFRHCYYMYYAGCFILMCLAIRSCDIRVLLSLKVIFGKNKRLLYQINQFIWLINVLTSCRTITKNQQTFMFFPWNETRFTLLRKLAFFIRRNLIKFFLVTFFIKRQYFMNTF